MSVHCVAGPDLAATRRPGVMVLGMHRSGTSVTTHALHRLGLSVGDPRGLLPARPDNPRGYWETRLLSELNENVLRAHGGTWSAPPSLPRGWTRGACVVAFRAEARRRFAAVFSDDGAWVWKDPRTCLLLELWRPLLVEAALLIEVRDPLAVAGSLRRRDGMSKALALALWERHLREALIGAQGAPVLVSRYDTLVDHPATWLDGAARLLSAVGVRLPAGAVGALQNVVEPALRHDAHPASAVFGDPEVSWQQRELYRCAVEHEGWHDRLALELPPETPSSDVVISAARGVTVARLRDAPEGGGAGHVRPTAGRRREGVPNLNGG
jgi:hypothetical protein